MFHSLLLSINYCSLIDYSTVYTKVYGQNIRLQFERFDCGLKSYREKKFINGKKRIKQKKIELTRDSYRI